jgi:hypothetical protein
VYPPDGSPGGCLFCDKPTIRYLEPRLWAELRSLHPMPDLSQSRVHPPDHLPGLVTKLLGNGVYTDWPSLIECLCHCAGVPAVGGGDLRKDAGLHPAWDVPRVGGAGREGGTGDVWRHRGGRT